MPLRKLVARLPHKSASGGREIHDKMPRGTGGMSSVISFRRLTASAKVIAALVKLGYLQEGQRHRDTAVERAVERLRRDLYRAGVICDGDLSRGDNNAGQEEAAQ
jgi:hypothetical protein